MTPDDITAAVQAGGLTHQQAIHVYAALYGQQPNAPTLSLPCEECGALTPLSHAVSYKLWVAMAGHPRVAGYDEHDQHFCCSHDCARAQIVKCFDAHLRPDAEQRVAAAHAQEVEAAAGVELAAKRAELAKRGLLNPVTDALLQAQPPTQPQE